MTRLITYLLIVLGAAMLAGCDDGDGGEKAPPIIWYTYDNGNTEYVNGGKLKIDVTGKPSVFDLCLFSLGCFRDVSVESEDPQCSAEIVGTPGPEYSDDGKFLGYSNVLRIDMRQEKSIKLTISHHETEWLSDLPRVVTLFRKENQQ